MDIRASDDTFYPRNFGCFPYARVMTELFSHRPRDRVLERVVATCPSL